MFPLKEKIHKHKVVGIKLRNRNDSVYLYCECGHVEAIGIWFHTAPPGWKKKNWKKLMLIVKSFIEW